MTEIQDRIKTALLNIVRDMVYEPNVLGGDFDVAEVILSGVEIPAPLGGGIFIEWVRDSDGTLVPSTRDADGLEFEIRYRRANPCTPQVDLLMARCASPEYAAAVAGAIHAEQVAEAIRHGHREFAETGLYCPTCLDLGYQALPEIEQTEGSS